MRLVVFLIGQVIGLLVLYFMYTYLFSEFEGFKAWGFMAVFIFFYIAYTVYDIVTWVQALRKRKNFRWR